MESNERVVLKGDGLEKYSNFTLMYPKQAIERKLEDLPKAQTEFDSFMKKVLGGLSISPRDTKPKSSKSSRSLERILPLIVLQKIRQSLVS
jgi:hypothetical protein